MTTLKAKLEAGLVLNAAFRLQFHSENFFKSIYYGAFLLVYYIQSPGIVFHCIATAATDAGADYGHDGSDRL